MEANTRWAARLKASSFGAGAYWLKKKIHAAFDESLGLFGVVAAECVEIGVT